jgi:hypothetical protein
VINALCVTLGPDVHCLEVIPEVPDTSKTFELVSVSLTSAHAGSTPAVTRFAIAALFCTAFPVLSGATLAHQLPLLSEDVHC